MDLEGGRYKAEQNENGLDTHGSGHEKNLRQQTGEIGRGEVQLCECSRTYASACGDRASSRMLRPAATWIPNSDAGTNLR